MLQATTCASGAAESAKVDLRWKTTFGYIREKHLSHVQFSVAIIGSSRDLNNTHIYATDIR